MACYDGAAGTPVGVFPANAGVLFVEANNVWTGGDGAVTFGFCTVEVLG